MSTYSRRVYSSEMGNICLQCGKIFKVCRCQSGSVDSRLSSGKKIKVSRESKGRKGSGVTLISGLSLNETELKKLASSFKQLCGSGGAVKQGVIEIQGEHRDTLLKELTRLGYQAFKAGG
jgi:translation initiation factor 1